MTDLAQKQAPQRRGFSLVLSLTIMAMILLMVITLASFLSIEARLASTNQLRTQARMQALVSLRLALAHLQQEAGPDRRATFRSDITRYATASSAGSVPSWSNALNPMWTGVQRTDRPFQPPAWIISGRGDKPAGTQMVSLAKPSTSDPNGTSFNPYLVSINYSTDYWIPWETGYPTASDTNKITLVGDATATAAEDEGNDPLSGRPDGRVSLPAVTLPDPNVSGRYCYWVGDEGVKANISLNDPRVQTGTSSNSSLTLARRGVGRTGVEILTGFSNYQPGDIDSRIRSSDQLKLLSSSVFSDSDGSKAKALWPDVTLVSRGLFADARWGGLQIDLSTAFEKTDADFMNSEFGSGNGNTEALTADVSIPGNVTFAFDTNGLITYPVIPSLTNSWRVPFKYWPKDIKFNNTITKYACVWSQPTTGSTASIAALRGPTWSAIRDYHLLYQKLTGNPSTLSARTHYPNTVALSASGVSNYPATLGYNHYSQMYNRSITPLVFFNGTSWVAVTEPNLVGINSVYKTDFIGNDTVYFRPNAGNKFNNFPNNSAESPNPYSLPIPTNVSVAPYISRQLIVIGVIKNASIVNIVISPITVFHNPYNVRLNIGKQRISLRDIDRWPIQFRRTYNYGTKGIMPMDTWQNPANAGLPVGDPMRYTGFDKWSPANYYLSLIKTNNPNATSAESLRFDIPAMTMEPGEFRIFTASSMSTNYAGSMTNAYNTNTGFYAPALSNFRTGYVPNTAQLLTTTRADTETLQIEMIASYTLPSGVVYDSTSNGGFKIVHQLECHPNDILPTGNASLTGYAFYNSCSVVSELTASPIKSQINGNYLDPATGIPANPAVGAQTNPLPYNVVDANMKLLGESPDIIGVYDYSVRWPNDPGPFPLFARSNPMATTTRVDASDFTWNSTTTAPGPEPFYSGSQYYANTSPSFKLEIRSASLWSDIIQVSGVNAYGGMSNNPSRGGVTNAVFTEVPLTPPLSLAQYAHANFGLRDHDPLFAIGNSLSPSFMTHGLWNRDQPTLSIPNPVPPTRPTPSKSSTYDQSVLCNKALFDRFFLSGVAVDSSTNRSITKVLDDFANGTGTLANPNTVLMSSFDATTTRSKLNNHRTVATVTAREGAFNVHSMSKRAWAAVLAGAKAKSLNNETGDSTNNARFPRAVRTDTVSTGNTNKAEYTNSQAWNGLTNLDDNQIKSLAKWIVNENLYKLHFYHREGNWTAVGGDFHKILDSTNIRGLNSGTPSKPSALPYGSIPIPYQGLAQFVNRTNCPVSAGAIRQRGGVIQTAIILADAESPTGARLANRNNTPDVSMEQLLVGNTYTTTGVPPPPYIPQTADNNTDFRGQTYMKFDTAPSATQDYGDVKMAAPTALLQSDVLAAIGDSLTTRSDTFTIRAYGDVSDKAGSPAAGTCWIEAVVQRIPDFIDTKDPAERMVCNLFNGYAHNDQNSNPSKGLQPVNINLGRRFVIVSMRILKPNEL